VEHVEPVSQQGNPQPKMALNLRSCRAAKGSPEFHQDFPRDFSQPWTETPRLGFHEWRQNWRVVREGNHLGQGCHGEVSISQFGEISPQTL